MEHLRCVVERITYQNAENGYSVIKCRAKGYQDLVTVVGSMPDVHVGSVLYLGGSWRIDAKYGRQFSMETFEETLPATVFGIEKYLGSGLVKGVGPKFAGRIVKQFGADTLNVIEEDPDRLLEVTGIGKVRVERIKKSWQEQKEIKNIMLFLQSHDVSTSHATKIYKTYGNDSIKVVQENPYRLAQSNFRSRFQLKEADFAYIKERGMETIQTHAAQIVRQRLAEAQPKNDGKQTPMRGAPKGCCPSSGWAFSTDRSDSGDHPVFMGQHATGTCCRGCLEKWHGIPKGKPLSEEEQEHVVDVLMQWIGRQMKG